VKIRILIALGALAITLGAPRSVHAQNAPAVTVSGGWNFLHVDEDGDDDLSNFPAGWYADVAARVAGPLSVVGQISGNYKEVNEVDLSIHTFMGGVRYTMASSVKPFVQVLFGAAHSKVTFVGVDESQNDGALQIGAGVDVAGGGPVGVRIGADYIRAFTEGEGTNAVRFGVGISFGR